MKFASRAVVECKSSTVELDGCIVMLHNKPRVSPVTVVTVWMGKDVQVDDCVKSQVQMPYLSNEYTREVSCKYCGTLES